MKLVSYLMHGQQTLGMLVHDHIFGLNACDKRLPLTMKDFLDGGEPLMRTAREVEKSLLKRNLIVNPDRPYSLLAPVPNPTSCRDGYAFRQHVFAARRNRGVGMIPEFDEYPIFYFTNHNSIQGEGDIMCMPDHFEKLDFELEIAVVIGKKGRNIKASEADSYIAGFMIMNDMSARTLQMEEMLLNLGPAKGKDFCTVIGPWLVTPDELSDYLVPAKQGHIGNSYDLQMSCSVNGVELSFGNVADMDWTFAEIIERASYGVDLMPGDVIGSGTVGTGCLLELNGTGLLHDSSFPVQWLKDGDEIEMEITGLGILRNKIVAEGSEYSILKLKKNAEPAL